MTSMIHIDNRNSLARMYIYYVNAAAWIQGAGQPSSFSVEGALASAARCCNYNYPKGDILWFKMKSDPNQ
jgi:hypothetical protein